MEWVGQWEANFEKHPNFKDHDRIQAPMETKQNTRNNFLGWGSAVIQRAYALTVNAASG